MAEVQPVYFYCFCNLKKGHKSRKDAIRHAEGSHNKKLYKICPDVHCILAVMGKYDVHPNHFGDPADFGELDD